MGVSIEGIDITGLVAIEDFGVPIIAESKVADDGSLVVYEKELKYNDITLEGGSDWGWMTLEVLNNIKVLASVIGATYILNYEGVESIVRFRTEDIPVISAERLFDSSITSDSTFYKNVVIKLMEV